MAQFLNQQKPERAPHVPGSGFDAMGKPVPVYRRSAAMQHCRDMGMSNTEDITLCVSGMANHLERDKPYEAMEHGMKFLDLTGTYRLIAVLCTAEEPQGPPEKPKVRVSAKKGRAT